jgi:hypothetical protein
MIRGLPSAINKKAWLWEHADSVVVLIITVATFVLIVWAETIDPGVYYYIPTGRSYFDHKIGVPP